MRNDIDSTRLPAREASPTFVDSKVQFLIDVHVWPERQLLDPQGWLNNFFASEKPFAYNMLNAFIYYNELMVDALLRGAVQQLSASITQSAPTLDDAKERWSSFLSALLVTYIPGEQPNPADSGNLFARKARQVLRLAEQQIME